MTKLYFIRHGKTQWNLEGRYQGSQGDSPLLPESYDEINLLAEHFSKIAFKKIYTSPLKRAVETATGIKNKLSELQGSSLDIVMDERLREFNLGIMEGEKFSFVEKKFAKEVNAFRNHPDQYDPSTINGESFPELINRMTPVIEEIIKKYNNDTDNVIIVSHGAALNALINSLLNVELADLRKRGGLANTSTTILERKNGSNTYNLLDWNDTSYLNKKIDPTDVI